MDGIQDMPIKYTTSKVKKKKMEIKSTKMSTFSYDWIQRYPISGNKFQMYG